MLIFLYPDIPLSIIFLFISGIAKVIYTQTLYNVTDLAKHRFDRPTKNTSMSKYVDRILKHNNVEATTKSSWKMYKKWDIAFKVFLWFTLFDLISFFILITILN